MQIQVHTGTHACIFVYTDTQAHVDIHGYYRQTHTYTLHIDRLMQTDIDMNRGTNIETILTTFLCKVNAQQAVWEGEHLSLVECSWFCPS